MSQKMIRNVCSVNGLGDITLEMPRLGFEDAARISDAIINPLVKSSAEALRDRAQVRAPKKSGDLARGIIVNPICERSSNPHKTVHDVVFDAGMNDTFVKMTKTGKRYYYPASQEYGFQTVNGKRVPGKYFMRDAAVDFAYEHRDRIAGGVERVLEEV